jgi:hypothetical protein
VGRGDPRDEDRHSATRRLGAASRSPGANLLVGDHLVVYLATRQEVSLPEVRDDFPERLHVSLVVLLACKWRVLLEAIDRDASSHWGRAPERQSARAGGPRGRADRAKSTSRRTYCARNFVVSEFSPAAQSLETSGYCRSGAVTTQPPSGPPAPSSGRCAKCLKGGTGRAPHRAPQAEPGADCPFVLAVAARQCDPDWCASAALSGGLEARHAAPAPTAETRFPVRS